MHRRKNVLALFAATLFASRLFAQAQDPTVDALSLQASNAYTWTEERTGVVLLQGPTTITLENVKMTADNAVVWLTPDPSGLLNEQRAQIALIGHATLKQGEVTRMANQQLVTATVRGNIRITADNRLGRQMTDSVIYKKALGMRPETAGLKGSILPSQTAMVAPTTMPTLPPAPTISFNNRGTLQTSQTPDGRVAIIISGGVQIFRTDPTGGFLELEAERAVLYTSLTKLTPEAMNKLNGSDLITSVYLEGDVRAVNDPAPTPGQQRLGEVRMTANRLYYDFPTDRAILTDVVLHTLEPKSQVPVIIRANVLRQLAEGEYRANNAMLSTSAFATPSYGVGIDKIYVREIPAESPDEPNLIAFQGNGVTMQMFGVPFFWLPAVSGTATENGMPLRQIEMGDSSRYGFGVKTTWGLFETLGKQRPRDLDATFHADYFSDRGPATGLDAKYEGGFVTETEKQPWSFQGDLQSYIIDDHGKDDLGSGRTDVTPPGELRGTVLWEHQQFLPNNWQIQIRAGYVSDATFLEEWFQHDYNNDLPRDLSFYAKKQDNTEAITFYSNVSPNGFITNADLAQEQFQVERLPELGYRRIGDAIGDDQFTWFSQNTVDRLRMDPSSATLAQQGFTSSIGPGSPGIPSIGQTGVDSSWNYRGDTRQEVDYPFTLGQFRIVPYVVGRYIPYMDSPNDNGVINRVYGSAGMRMTTAFWKVDDSAESDLFDIHRIRHVIEPSMNILTSGQTEDRNQVFIYEEPVDGIYDYTGGQIALLQRWQTKRGGPGRWHSVDFFTLNVEGNYFSNRPSDNELPPNDFRGLFFDSFPEASVPRDSINADATWRITDETAMLADEYWNADQQSLATASIGLAVQRDPRVTYFLGNRYIEDLQSNITSFVVDYRLTAKYEVAFSQAYDWAQTHNVSSAITIVRHFDRFFIGVTTSYDNVDGEGGIRVVILPEGFHVHGPTDITSVFGPSGH